MSGYLLLWDRLLPPVQMTAQPNQLHSLCACQAASQLLATHLMQQDQRRLQQLLAYVLHLPELLQPVAPSGAHCTVEA
jgi:hypothetical protein